MACDYDKLASYQSNWDEARTAVDDSRFHRLEQIQMTNVTTKCLPTLMFKLGIALK